jgi:hypothetical protein
MDKGSKFYDFGTGLSCDLISNVHIDMIIEVILWSKIMPRIVQHKNLTVRLTPDVYHSAMEIAKRRHISMNALLQESLLQTIRITEEQKCYNDYSLLGQEADTAICDVEYAIHAQAEVMLNGDSS